MNSEKKLLDFVRGIAGARECKHFNSAGDAHGDVGWVCINVSWKDLAKDLLAELETK